MLNVVALMGRLVADPELKTTQSGVSVTSFTLAVERSYVKSGTDRQTDFIDVVVWRGTAEFVCKYFTKGQLVVVQGSIQTRTYTDKDGNKHKAFEVMASNVHFAESKRQKSEATNPSIEKEAPGKEFEEISASDDDLPFDSGFSAPHDKKPKMEN